MCRKITFYTKNNLAFKKNNSTEYAILQLTNELKESYHNREFTIGVFFIDLSKAFDTVDHNILLTKTNLFRTIQKLY